jgi:hypothetical protein
MATVIEFRAADDVTALALTWPDRARALTIENDTTYIEAGEMLKGIKALRKEVDDAFDPIIKKAHEAHKEACGQKKKAETPLLDAETILKRGLVAYETEQERLRQIEQRRLQEEARQIDEARRLEEAAALERQAVATGDETLRAEAEELISAPVCAPAVYVPPSTPKVSGISYRENWRIDPNVDLKALCLAIAQGRQPVSLILPNVTALNGLARSLKGEMKVPGVKVVCEKIASASGR